MKKRKIAIFAALILMLSQLVLPASALPSIGNLHTEMPTQVTITMPEDSANTAEVLIDEGIYCSQAVASQYAQTDESGKTVETELSRMITASESVIRETGVNGQGILEEVPSGRQLLRMLQPDALAQTPTDAPTEATTEPQEPEFDLNRLDQLTYMLDLKYLTTGYRVTSCVQASVNGKDEVPGTPVSPIQPPGFEWILHGSSPGQYGSGAAADVWCQRPAGKFSDYTCDDWSGCCGSGGKCNL